MNPHDPNNEIDHVLKHLGTTPTPAGLEQRVLKAVQTRTSPLAPRTWIEALQSLAATPVFRIASALAAVAILFAASVVTHRHVNPQPLTADTQTRPPQLRAVPSAKTLRTPRSLFAPTPHEAKPPARQPAQAADLATLETLAPSLLSPTLPLTTDERLMRSIVRHSDFPQLAELHIPDPPPAGVAPIFAGFIARPEEDAQIPAADPNALLALVNDNQ